MKKNIIYVNGNEFRLLIIVIMAMIYRKDLTVLSLACLTSALDVIDAMKPRKVLAIIIDCRFCLLQKTIRKIMSESSETKLIIIKKNNICNTECLKDYSKITVHNLREAFNYIPRS